MARLFDGEVDVAYMQFYVETPEVIPHDMERRFAGQTNGLCGAGEAGMLQCTTGLHTGPVPVAVDLPGAVEMGMTAAELRSAETVVSEHTDLSGDPVLELADGTAAFVAQDGTVFRVVNAYVTIC